jgi:hypothetical protein
VIYITKQEECVVKTKGCSFIRVALLTPEEVEDLLREGVYDVAATEKAAAMIKETSGLKSRRCFKAVPLWKRGIR